MFKPNRLIFEKAETPSPRAEKAETPETKPKPLPEEVKKAHEEQRQKAQKTLKEGLKSDNSKIRETAASYLIKLEKLEVGYLTVNTRELFISRYRVTIEQHTEKKEADEKQISGIRRHLANRMASENTEVSNLASKAIQKLNEKQKEKKMTKAEAEHFLAEYEIQFDYYDKHEEVASIIKEMEGIPKERKEALDKGFTEIYKPAIEKLFPNMPESEKSKLTKLRSKVKATESQTIDAVKLTYSKPAVTLDQYRKNPASLNSEIVKLRKTTDKYKSEVHAAAKKVFRGTSVPNYEAFIANQSAKNQKLSLENIEYNLNNALSELKGMPKADASRRKLRELAKIAQDQLKILPPNDSEGDKVRAKILCSFRDDTTKEILKVKPDSDRSGEKSSVKALEEMYTNKQI